MATNLLDRGEILGLLLLHVTEEDVRTLKLSETG